MMQGPLQETTKLICTASLLIQHCCACWSLANSACKCYTVVTVVSSEVVVSDLAKLESGPARMQTTKVTGHVSQAMDQSKSLSKIPAEICLDQKVTMLKHHSTGSSA